MSPLFAFRLQPHHAVPPTPTNADRIRAYRALAPVELGNDRKWKWHQYAREAAPSSEVEYAQQLREGFEFKYGSK